MLVIYAVVVLLFVGFGIAAKDSGESAFMFGYAAVLALPLSIMVPVLYIGTIRQLCLVRIRTH